MYIRVFLIASSSIFAITNCSAASAQDLRETSDEIIVTAQKRESSLQDTPIAISAFTGDALAERGINDVSNLQSSVPNLNVGQVQDGFQISLRGIGLQGSSSITDGGVAFYVDNIYVGRPSGGSATFFDIQRIEVLRGPQGTLYGRNATGGVVNVISKEPSKYLEGVIGATYGSRNLFELRGVLNVPLTDIAAFRVSAMYHEEDGYVKNLSTESGTGDFFGSDGDITVRGQLLVGSPDEIEVLLSGTYSKLNGTGVAMSFLERNNVSGPGPVQALVATIPADNPDPLKTNNDSPAFNDTETTSAMVRLKKDFGGVEAVIQGGKMWQNTNLLQDFDGSPVDISVFPKSQESESTSLEARLASNDGGPFSWIIGGYYFKESTYILRENFLNGLTPGGIISFPQFALDEWGASRTVAVFGTATYVVVDGLRMSAGLRYTDDKKSGSKVTRGNFGAPFPLDIPNAFFPGVASFDKLNWKAGLEWDAAPDVLVYGSVSTGYKAGGFNLTSDASPYDPENITAYEFGIKSDLFDRRLRFNLDSYYYDYTDMQLTTLGTFPGSNTPGQFTTNAGKARIYGVEVETRFKVTSDFSLMASYAYANAKFQELCNIDPRTPGPSDVACTAIGRTGVDLGGYTVPFVSKHTINLGADYEIYHGSSGSLKFAVNHNWHSKRWLREFNVQGIDDVPANGKTDITVTYNVADIGLKVTGYVTNLENDVEKTNIYLTPGFISTNATTTYTKPRTIGVRMDYSF